MDIVMPDQDGIEARRPIEEYLGELKFPQEAHGPDQDVGAPRGGMCSQGVMAGSPLS